MHVARVVGVPVCQHGSLAKVTGLAQDFDCDVNVKVNPFLRVDEFFQALFILQLGVAVQ